MKMTDEEKKPEQKMFTAIWELYKKYYTPEDTEEYWDALVKEAGEISKGFNRVGIELVVTLINGLEEKAKANRQAYNP